MGGGAKKPLNARTPLTFSKHGQLHIKLKGITKCSNMVANILPEEPHLFPRP